MKLENLELADVMYESDGKKAVLVFLDEDKGEVREVNLNKQLYKNGEFVDDEERAEKMEQVAKEHFNLPFNKLKKAIGTKKTIYAYDKFNALIEMKQVEKFDKSMVGQLIEGEVTEVVDDGVGIKIRFDYEGKIYEAKMQYSDYMESKNQWFVNPIKRRKQYDKFMDKFGEPIYKHTLVGKKVIVEVRLAMNKYVWNDIKPLPKKKK